MARIYVANYALQGDFEAECDDNSTFDMGLEGLASPQVMAVFMNSLYVGTLQNDVELAVLEMHEEDDEKPDMVWETAGWQDRKPGGGRPHEIFTLKDKTNGDVLAMLVVQEVDLH